MAKSTTPLSLLLAGAALLCAPVHADKLGPIYTIQGLTSKYQDFIADKDISQISDYRNPHPGRELIEIVLLHQALALGGYRGDLMLLPSAGSTYDQRLNRLAQGRFLASAQTIWRRDADKFRGQFYLSAPVIRNGEYRAGIYTTAQNTELLKVTTLHQLSTYSAVSNRQWKNDWYTLEAMNIKHIHHSSLWTSHIKMVATGRADFMLLPFLDNTDLDVYYNPSSYEFLSRGDKNGVTLTPIPNIAVAIQGSRHFAISKKHPSGRATIEMLDAGLKILRQKKLITKALTQSGFFIAKTKHWRVINPTMANELAEP